MVQTLMPTPSVREKLFHQAAVDSDFRAELDFNPDGFGVSIDVMDLPVSVERQNKSFLELLADGMDGTDVFACATTCSSGPFTIVCDGTTKSD